MMPELKPCPFCGQRPVLQKDIRYPRPECKPRDAFEVVCKNWDCVIGYVDERYKLTAEEAVEWWNDRADEPVVRCKDCRYNYGRSHLTCFNKDDIVCEYHMSDGFRSDDFCSRGVRMDGEPDDDSGQ